MRCSPCYMNGIITDLEKNNANVKLAEIDAIGFGFVKRIPHWAVKQSIMVQLAKAYDVDTNTLIVDVGNICINAELVGRDLSIPDESIFDDIFWFDLNGFHHINPHLFIQIACFCVLSHN
ncbi:hypothetical protein AHAS_Ahas17G0148300 [Arachis hypogaea]